MSYRDLTDAIWATYPSFRQHMLDLYQDEKRARTEQRIRMGMLVRDNHGVFTATKSEGIVLVGLAATEADVVEDVDEGAAEDENTAEPSVYWYTFPAYRKANGPYPIKVGRGSNPLARITQQVTAIPEIPEILGTFPHPDNVNLERALHAILTLRGKRKKDAPGAEWFVTTPAELTQLIELVLGHK